jgi:subtilisin family serine protease
MKSRAAWLCAGMLLLLRTSPAQVVLPKLPDLPPPLPLPEPAPLLKDTTGTAIESVRSSTRLRANALLRRYPRQVERDPRGAPVVRSVIIALSPDPQALQQALDAGYQILADTDLAPIEERVVTLLAPRDVSTQRALQQLRQRDPEGSYDFDHLYTESAAPGAVEDTAAATARASAATGPSPVRVGLIDSGIDVDHPVFRTQPPEQRGCDGARFPDAHGTAVASLLVGAAPPLFRGADPGAPLIAIDVYCGVAEPGGRVRDIVTALAELSGSGVAVINISMVGPDNAVLAAMVRRVLQRSIVIVAAAGNDGPRAAPLFPAAYPGVIAVSAVDARDKVLLEAGGGRHVLFAAPGADMVAAEPGGRYQAVRGTSYAAPLVAGLIARHLADADTATPQQVLQKLEAAARDQGRKGRDTRYGYGVLAGDLRTPPSAVAGKAVQ